jgi:replication factor C subunit 1
MECLDAYSSTLERHVPFEKIRKALQDFKDNKHDLTQMRGIYVYGAPGSGKSKFVKDTLVSLGYDIVRYDAGDIRNKSIIDTITRHNMSDRNVLSLLKRESKPIAIVMDEIDGMNNGDKGGINSLIKLIRPKKTKKQKTEESTGTPIVCIGNYHVDKKIKELMRVCVPVEIRTPTNKQTKELVSRLMTDLDDETSDAVVKHVQGDLRKLSSMKEMYDSPTTIVKKETMRRFLLPKSYNEDTKDITRRLLNNDVSIDEHLTSLNDTDRTIVGLLWHENVVDCLTKLPKSDAFPVYLEALDNICYADYIDRVTFQKQIWQFNEMSSLMKTFNNNRLYHGSFKKRPKYNPSEVRFTKVLTKYSTEYNNSVFVQGVCQKLNMDRKDAFSFFLDMRNKHSDESIYKMFETYDINKLDINRIYRYLDKYTRKDCDIDD